MKDLVSIITPVYNGEKYLSETINSVLNQDYQNWELILINDCSTDKSAIIMNEYLNLDKRIKLISSEYNQGVAYSRNIGIKVAKGRYISFLDSDDLWLSKKLSTQIRFMQKNNYIFTFSSYELVDDNGVRLNKVIIVPSEVDYKSLLKGNSIGCLTVMIDRKGISDVSMPEIRHEDYATWLNILKGGINAYGIKENLAMYRKSSNSLSSNKFKAVTWTWNIYRNNQKLGLVNSIKYFLAYIFKTTLKYIQ